MKKIMFLGGSQYIVPLIKIAKEMGIYVITCDYLPNNIAHKYSDEYVNESIIDKDAVLKVSIEHSIDGISSFACDPGVVTAAYVANRMGLPCAGPLDSTMILQNKYRFRSFLKEHHFNVPWFFTFDNRLDAIEGSSLLKYPCIVKPVDSAGSKGVSKVNNIDEYNIAVDLAFKLSLNGKIIVEEFLEIYGNQSDSDCFSIDGKLVFKSFSKQIFDKKAPNPFVPCAFSWPTTIDSTHVKVLENELQRLITLLSMGTSIYNVESRLCTNGKVYIMEVSPRGGGNRLSEMAEIVYNSQILKNHIKAILGEKIDPADFSMVVRKHVVELILHSNKDGFFSTVRIKPEFQRYVRESDLWVNSGDRVEKFTGANKSIGTLVFEFDSEGTKELFLDDLDNNVVVELK